MWRGKWVSIFIVFGCICLLCSAFNGALPTVPKLGSTRGVFQVADVVGGRSAPLNAVQKLEAEKTVVGEFSNVKHVRDILTRTMEHPSSQCSLEMSLNLMASYKR
ncbi:H/ACA ribonucleoprotein complex subunit 2-like protein [Olea europaea subsp. europaea]|uniref:H/ACA ribonucleoprotein complex subunit 2-like protein n=1 Tax=Olea europaea subsp. europaea TaxID=158383 RepID=A0A8S0PNC1_OLEEU|nr:H/ACA ribonucleoprotein complex subunit 2-like protein [Olea europaea subsp. europaea]